MTTFQKILTGIVAVGYWLISPLFTEVRVNEKEPENIINQEGQKVPSGVDNLSPEEKEKMEEMTREANATDTKAMDESMPEMVEEKNEFAVQGTQGHPAEGTVRILETTTGTVIRYEDFETINGPKLHLYLTKTLEADEFVDLGPVKGTKGNINYSVPDDVDLNDYNYVMYWCKPFGVLFNYAEINPPAQN